MSEKGVRKVIIQTTSTERKEYETDEAKRVNF